MPMPDRRSDFARRSRRGLTRVEVLVVGLVLLGAVAAAAMYVQQLLVGSRRTACEARLTAVGLAVLAREERAGEFPGYRQELARDAAGVRQAGSWVFPILPHLYSPGADAEAAPPYAPLAAAHGPDGPDATRGLPPAAFVPELACPADRPPDSAARAGWLSYAANAGLPDGPADGTLPPDWPANGVFLDRFAPAGRDTAVSLAYLQDHDGAEATLLLAENVDAGPWTEPQEPRVGLVWTPGGTPLVPAPALGLLRFNERPGEGAHGGEVAFARPASFHPGGANACFGDGGVRFLSAGIDYLVWVRLMTPSDPDVQAAGGAAPLPPPYRDRAEEGAGGR